MEGKSRRRGWFVASGSDSTVRRFRKRDRRRLIGAIIRPALPPTHGGGLVLITRHLSGDNARDGSLKFNREINDDDVATRRAALRRDAIPPGILRSAVGHRTHNAHNAHSRGQDTWCGSGTRRLRSQAESASSSRRKRSSFVSNALPRASPRRFLSVTKRVAGNKSRG